MSDYPEHDKLEKIKDISQELGKFLDENSTKRRGEREPRVRLGGAWRWRSIENVLAEWFKIDTKKLDEEKRAMLAALRSERGAH